MLFRFDFVVSWCPQRPFSFGCFMMVSPFCWCLDLMHASANNNWSLPWVLCSTAVCSEKPHLSTFVALVLGRHLLNFLLGPWNQSPQTSWNWKTLGGFTHKEHVFFFVYKVLWVRNPYRSSSLKVDQQGFEKTGDNIPLKIHHTSRQVSKYNHKPSLKDFLKAPENHHQREPKKKS